jgi:hypothetical protein
MYVFYSCIILLGKRWSTCEENKVSFTFTVFMNKLCNEKYYYNASIHEKYLSNGLYRDYDAKNENVYILIVLRVRSDLRVLELTKDLKII